MDHDRFSDTKSVEAIPVTTISSATTTEGTWIDTFNYRSLTIGLHVDWTVGDITSIGFDDADEDNQSDEAPLDDSKVLYYPTQFPIGADTILHIGCISKKRYVRLNIVTLGGSVDIDVVGTGTLGHAISKPERVESSVLETSDINIGDTEGDTIVTTPKRTS